MSTKKSLPAAIKIYKGLSIYRVNGSMNWYVRIWDSKKKKYLVKSTGCDNAVQAREVAQELGLSLLRNAPQVETSHTFKHFALKMLNKANLEVQRGDKSKGYNHSLKFSVQNADWGLLDYFGDADVRTLKTLSYETFLNHIARKRPDLSASTKNTLMAAFRNVLKIARDEGVIDYLPETPRTKQRDNPRPFFRFHPLVSKDEDAYQMLMKGVKDMIGKDVDVRGFEVDEELYDLMLFLTHSFVRPTMTELYAIKHSDVTIADDPKRLIVTVRNGKTGYRGANTMPAAVSVYERIKERHSNHSSEDYIFYPEYDNRQTISAMVQRLFKKVLDELGLERDVFTEKKHTLYSLRHTAICMRIVNSEGQVNIYNLAKNAGTSVNQIERFYAKHLPLSAELARNLQSFGK
jgi:hypothetical protein